MKHSEVELYISYAKQHGYVVVLVEPRTPWTRRPIELQAKSPHGVPLMTIRKRLEQYEEIVPIYFAWFISPAHCEVLQTLAKDVLMKCLQLTDFQHGMKEFTGELIVASMKVFMKYSVVLFVKYSIVLFLDF